MSKESKKTNPAQYQVTIKVTVPNGVDENGCTLRYKPKRLSGILVTINKMTVDDVGKEVVRQIKGEYLGTYPNVMVEVVGTIKIKDDFICYGEMFDKL